MRILLITANYLPYPEFGAERTVRLLANALVDARHEVLVLATCPATEARRGQIDNHEVEYVEQHNLYWSGDRAHQSFAAKIGWHLRDTRNQPMGKKAGSVFDEWRPDIVHTNILAGFSVDVWKAAHERRIPIVHTLHDYYLLCPRSSMFDGNAACDSHCVICRGFSGPRVALARHLAAVTAPSNAVLQAHTSRKVFAKTTETRIVQYVCPATEQLSQNAPGEERTIGFIGRLTVDKGVEKLLEWFLSTADADIRLRLVMAGTGPLEPVVRKAACDDHRIAYLGYVKPQDFFPGLSALIVPSIWHDPSPVVIREAYSFGIPVVGSTFGGIPELVTLVDDRLVFDPFEPETLTHSVTLALDPSLRPQLKSRASAAMAAFTANRVRNEMVGIYERAATKERGA